MAVVSRRRLSPAMFVRGALPADNTNALPHEMFVRHNLGLVFIKESDVVSMPSPRTAAVGDERDSRPLIGAEGSSSSSSSQGGSSSAAPPGTSGWRNLQKVYGSEVQPPPQLRSHGSIPEEGPVSPDPSFMRFNRGEASAEPPPEHEGSGLPLLQATLSRAQCLCLAQSGLSLAVVACAAVLGEPSWLRWLLLAGVAFGVVELGRVQMNGLSYAALSTRLRAAPPAYLLINTAQPPLMQRLLS